MLAPLVRGFTARLHLEGHSGFTLSAAFCPDGTLLAMGGSDYGIKLWDLARHDSLPDLTRTDQCQFSFLAPMTRSSGSAATKTPIIKSPSATPRRPFPGSGPLNRIGRPHENAKFHHFFKAGFTFVKPILSSTTLNLGF